MDRLSELQARRVSLLDPKELSRNAVNLGSMMGPNIYSRGFKRVHIIAHSAGVWAANEIGAYLCRRGVQVNATFLDAFVPSRFVYNVNQVSHWFLDTPYTPDKLGQWIPMEQYFCKEPIPGFGIGE